MMQDENVIADCSEELEKESPQDNTSQEDNQQIQNKEKDISNEHLAKEIDELKESVQMLRKKVEELDADKREDVSKAHSSVNQKKKFVWVKEVVFYILIAALLVGVFFVRGNADGQPVMIAGYSAFMVKTGSMQRDIPKGSLVVTKSVDADTLNVGDDITYMVNATTSITHRIIGITENHNDTGARAFQTQGTMNSKPDENLVPADNIVGKVVFHSEAVGMAAAFISSNWPIILFVMVIIFALFFVLRKTLNSEPRKTPPKSEEPHEKA